MSHDLMQAKETDSRNISPHFHSAAAWTFILTLRHRRFVFRVRAWPPLENRYPGGHMTFDFNWNGQRKWQPVLQLNAGGRCEVETFAQLSSPDLTKAQKKNGGGSLTARSVLALEVWVRIGFFDYYDHRHRRCIF